MVREAEALFVAKGEGRRHGHGFADARRFDQQVVEAALGGEPPHLDEQVFAQRAADAAVAHLDELLVGARERRAAVATDERGVDVHLAHVVHEAIPLFVFTAADSGAALEATVRYAFSYDLVPASMASTNVNLDAGDLTAYQTMVTRGWTQLIEGTATYRGVAPMAGSPFADYPTSVRFSFGFGAPSAYANCNNPDNGAEDAPGVQPSGNGRARAQVTIHTDHSFWEALGREDPPLHFDHLAARATVTGSAGVVTLDDLMGVVPTNLRDRMNRQVPDRGGQTMGYTARNAMALSFDPGGTAGISDLRDFVVFSTRASGHLNADGLCAIRPSGALRF